MQDATPCFPTPPSLNLTLFQRPSTLHPAALLHQGWCASRSGEPLDEAQPMGWQEGWLLWHRTHPTLDAQITACVVALRDMLQQVDHPEAPAPLTHPWL